MSGKETEFAGKTILITGAASGVGRASALAFAKGGASVVLVDRDKAGLEESRSLLSGEAKIILADLSDPAVCADAVQQSVERFGQLDALCNVAGICRFSHSADVTADVWDQMFAINVRAPFLLIQAALPHLRQTEGAVVNVASAAAFMGQAYLAAYAASKAALVNMTRSLAMEYLRSSVRINAIAPGGLMTPMAFSMMPPEGVDTQLMQRYLPMRGMVDVGDIAELIAMLAGPRGRSFHGACLNADNGMTAG